jgi:sucrose phosphorylase
MSKLTPLLDHLTYLYGEMAGQAAFDRLIALIDKYRSRLASKRKRMKNGGYLTERDAILITYPDQVREPGKAPLNSLAEFCEQRLSGLIRGIHVLPFYPWSSDDGFSVIDYRAVDPEFGDWSDVARLGRNFRLMFDAVINHISSQSLWFKGFLQDNPHYSNYFICVEGDPDLSHIVRPRTLPLLTRFDTPSGPKKVWTTFSEDQLDLNYHNPDVLLEIIDTLLFYIAQGAEFIRLDAIAYLWKEVGTPSIHQPQTHRIIQLFRAVLDAIAPQVLLITETNVAHAENLSYFGDGTNEAQLVYNFALPPLVMHTFRTGNAGVISEWASGLALPPGRVTFFNFLASHDGIGLNPARGLLSEPEIHALVEQTRAHGGCVSYKSNPDGAHSPYELNINFFDALSDPQGGEAITLQVDRFMAAQAFMLSLAGVPGIYFHSLFGSRGWREGVQQTGRSRSINRQKLERAALERELEDPESLRYYVFRRYARLLEARAASQAFHPFGWQRILEAGESIFAVLRLSPGEKQRILCLQNVSDCVQVAGLDFQDAFGADSNPLLDLISGQQVGPAIKPGISLQPYQTLWLVENDEAQ